MKPSDALRTPGLCVLIEQKAQEARGKGRGQGEPERHVRVQEESGAGAVGWKSPEGRGSALSLGETQVNWQEPEDRWVEQMV